MRFILDFKNDTSDEDIKNYLNKNECIIIKNFNHFEKLFLVDAPIQPPLEYILENVINDEINNIDLLGYHVINDNNYDTVSYETNDESNWWKLISSARPNYDIPVQTINRRGESSAVYIVDSGIMHDHQEFDGVTIEHLYSFNGDINDYNGHGTAIASIISGKNTGITNAKLKSVKIFQAGVQTLQSHLLTAFETIITDVLNNKTTFPVVNLSWSIPKNEFIENKIRSMVAFGIPVIVSAGNSGTEIENVTPASMPEVCTVGAYGRDFRPCMFSNYTSDVSNTKEDTNHGAIDVWAPGEYIRIARLDGTIGYGSGTSFSTAIHSAATAYNSFMCVYEDLTLLESVVDNSLQVLMFSSDKRGILILEDKYSSSVNIMSRFQTAYDGDNSINFGYLKDVNIVCETGKKITKRLFSPLVAKEYIIDSLPEGLSINNGFIVGTVNVTEISTHKTTITYTKFSNETRTTEINFYLFPENINIENSNLDQSIVIKLLAFCGEENGFCSGNCDVQETCYECEGGPKFGGYCLCSDTYCM